MIVPISFKECLLTGASGGVESLLRLYPSINSLPHFDVLLDRKAIQHCGIVIHEDASERLVHLLGPDLPARHRGDW